MAGAWDLGTPDFFQSPSSRVQPVQKCQGLPGGSDCLGGWLWSPARREGARGDLAPGLACQSGEAGRSLFRKIPSKSWTPDSSWHKSCPVRDQGSRLPRGKGSGPWGLGPRLADPGRQAGACFGKSQASPGHQTPLRTSPPRARRELAPGSTLRTGKTDLCGAPSRRDNHPKNAWS